MVETLQPAALALILTFPILSTIVVALRIWSRWISKSYYWDDALILVAWALAVGQACVVYAYTIKSWAGYHDFDIPELSTGQRIESKKLDLANQLLYNPILSIVKMYVIIFLTRLDDKRQTIRIALVAFFSLNLGLMIATFFADLFQCTPISYYWDSVNTDKLGMEGAVIEPGGTCIDQVEFFLISAGFAVLTDILILLIPVAILWRLKMARKQKVGVGVIMSLGWIVTGIGVARIVLYYYQFRPDNVDRSYGLTYCISGIEVNVAIITACGPALKALAARYAPRLAGSRSGKKSGDHAYGPSHGYSRQVDAAVTNGGQSAHELKSIKPGVARDDAASEDWIMERESIRTK